MTPDTPLKQHLVRVGEVYFQWDSKDRHHLAVDLSGALPVWVAEADGAVVPLEDYLGLHPGRREEVRQQIRLRLGAQENRQ